MESMTELAMAQAVEFILEKLDSLSQQELASRMTLNCVNCKVDTRKLGAITTTIIDVFDESALSSQTIEALRSHYPNAKLAHLKTGGNFPYLSRSDDVNMHLFVHLRQFTPESRQCAQKPMDKPGDDDNDETDDPAPRQNQDVEHSDTEVGVEAI